MKTEVQIIIIGMFLISFVSAINLNSGETNTINVGNYEYYKIDGNLSDCVNISRNGNLANISINKYCPSGEIEINFYGKKPVNSGSSGSQRVFGDFIDENNQINNKVNDEPEIILEEQKSTYLSYIIYGIIILAILIIARLIRLRR